MGEKRIMISECLIEDLIYGRLKGPVKSDAPIGMKILAISDEYRPHSTDRTGDINVLVTHPDFEEIAQYTELPILSINFTNELDLATRDLISGLHAIAITKYKEGTKERKLIDIACNMLFHNDAKYDQLVRDNMNLDKKNGRLQATIYEVIATVKHHEVKDES